MQASRHQLALRLPGSALDWHMHMRMLQEVCCPVLNQPSTTQGMPSKFGTTTRSSCHLSCQSRASCGNLLLLAGPPFRLTACKACTRTASLSALDILHVHVWAQHSLHMDCSVDHLCACRQVQLSCFGCFRTLKHLSVFSWHLQHDTADVSNPNKSQILRASREACTQA